MESHYLRYLLKLITEEEERASFQNNPDEAMGKAGLNSSEQHALMSLALIKMDPKDIGAAVLEVLNDGYFGLEGGGGGPGHGPP